MNDIRVGSVLLWRYDMTRLIVFDIQENDLVFFIDPEAFTGYSYSEVTFALELYELILY